MSKTKTERKTFTELTGLLVNALMQADLCGEQLIKMARVAFPDTRFHRHGTDVVVIKTQHHSATSDAAQ